jgi:hypothetical protein
MTHSSDSAIELGRLANNYMTVQSLQASLSRSEMNVTTIPKLVLRIITDASWKEWIVPDTGQKVDRWKATSADFREFIRTPRPLGCGTSVEILERLIRGTPAWEPYLEATRGKPGGCHVEGGHNPDGTNQWFNRNIITDEPPTTIPLQAESVQPRARDYKRESKQGTSVSYTLRRLAKNRPDLLERVKAGELSPHAAARMAGFVEKAITIPDDPVKAARLIRKHFKDERLEALLKELST